MALGTLRFNGVYVGCLCPSLFLMLLAGCSSAWRGRQQDWNVRDQNERFMALASFVGAKDGRPRRRQGAKALRLPLNQAVPRRLLPPITWPGGLPAFRVLHSSREQEQLGHANPTQERRAGACHHAPCRARNDRTQPSRDAFLNRCQRPHALVRHYGIPCVPGH